MKIAALIFLFLTASTSTFAWVSPSWVGRPTLTVSRLAAQVGIFYGTSTGSTSEVAELIYQAFGDDVAAEPVDVDTLDGGDLANIFGEHGSLVVGTPTWNTGADQERSGTGWDEIYYNKLPTLRAILKDKKVAVFGLGDQESYSENFADATGELFDAFEGLGCRMLGPWSQDGYFHDNSKSIRGDKFCGLICDMVNQEELSEERVEQWVAQLKKEGILGGEVTQVQDSITTVTSTNDSRPVDAEDNYKELQLELEESSQLLDTTITQHSTGIDFTPHYNPKTGKTMWVSADGRESFVTVADVSASTKLNP